jgi:hypothetical protein
MLTHTRGSTTNLAFIWGWGGSGLGWASWILWPHRADISAFRLLSFDSGQQPTAYTPFTFLIPLLFFTFALKPSSDLWFIAAYSFVFISRIYQLFTNIFLSQQISQ